MKIEQWEKAKKHLTRPSRKVLETKAKKEMGIPDKVDVNGSKILHWINYNNKLTGGNTLPITEEEKKVATEIEKSMYPPEANDLQMANLKKRIDNARAYVTKPKQYTKEFKNEDPTTYLSNEDQQKNMLLDTIDTKTKKPKYKKGKWTYESWADGLEERTRPVKKEPIKIVKKPKPIKPIAPLDPFYDWRLAPWWDFPEDDDVKPEEDKTRIREKIKTGITKLI